jgi:hypothetical protein
VNNTTANIVHLFIVLLKAAVEPGRAGTELISTS